MPITLLDPLSEPRWDRLVASHPDNTPFHGSAWARIMARTYVHKPLYLHCAAHIGAKGDGWSRVLLPLMEVNSCLTGRRGVSLPFTDFCGPLFFGDPKILSPLLSDSLFKLARERRWKHIELRDYFTLVPGGIEPRATTPSATFYGHSLDLRPGNEALFQGFKSSVRTAIRKAEKSGLDVKVSSSREALIEFYALQVQTRRRHGLPPQPLAFFLNIQKHLLEAGQGFIVSVSKDGRSLASLIFLIAGRTAIYKFGASDKGGQQYRANNLSFWEGIKRLTQLGVENLHFGRTSLADEGTRQFKLTWGTGEHTIRYHRYRVASQTWASPKPAGAGLHKAIFSRLPLAVNRIAGAMLYPHMD